jgi:hypothetical protein
MGRAYSRAPLRAIITAPTAYQDPTTAKTAREAISQLAPPLACIPPGTIAYVRPEHEFLAAKDVTIMERCSDRSSQPFNLSMHQFENRLYVTNGRLWVQDGEPKTGLFGMLSRRHECDLIAEQPFAQRRVVGCDPAAPFE